jgi:hypothetical protein
MRPTKLLPVRGSLREFQELDSSSQDLQTQRRPHQVFSRFSNQTLTKKVAGLICLAWICAGTVFVEYEMLLLCRAAFVVSAAACAVAVISGALYRAPEGDERADGLHIRERNPPRPFLLARSEGSVCRNGLPVDKTGSFPGVSNARLRSCENFLMSQHPTFTSEHPRRDRFSRGFVRKLRSSICVGMRRQ